MNKYVVLGVNENPTYLYYLPLINWAWRKLGWKVVLLTAGDETKVSKFQEPIWQANKNNDTTWARRWVEELNGYKSETLAQVSRLFGARVTEDIGLVMTSDADMLPLSDYWQPKDEEVTTYGRDLTDYHYPICYIAMDTKNWYKVMGYFKTAIDHDIELNLKHYYPIAKNKWCVDQDMITDRLLRYGKEKITHINRGTDKRTGYPIGRVDRSHWTLDHKQLIDAHLPHDILTNEKSFHNVMQLLHTVWPKEDWKWFINYTKEFKKLL